MSNFFIGLFLGLVLLAGIDEYTFIKKGGLNFIFFEQTDCREWVKANPLIGEN